MHVNARKVHNDWKHQNQPIWPHDQKYYEKTPQHHLKRKTPSWHQYSKKTVEKHHKELHCIILQGEIPHLVVGSLKYYNQIFWGVHFAAQTRC